MWLSEDDVLFVADEEADAVDAASDRSKRESTSNSESIMETN